MIDDKRLLTRINDDYKKRIYENKDKLIEAFVRYYGEEYRELIKERFNKIIFCWYPSSLIDVCCINEIPILIIKDRIKWTLDILDILGCRKGKVDIESDKGHVTLKKDKIVIDPGKINSATFEDGTDAYELLNFIFGKRALFDFDLKQNKIYNFFSYDEETQKEIIKTIYKDEKVPDDVLDRIVKINIYIDSLKEKQKEEERYIDFYLFYSCVNNKIERILKMLFSKNNKDLIEYGKIIGATDDALFSDYFKDYLKGINQYATIRSEAFRLTVDENNTVVSFPILLAYDNMIIHEINHCIVSTILAICTKIDGTNEILEKRGFYKPTDYDSAKALRIFEEIMNDRSTQDITNIFHELGGNIFDKDRIEIENSSLYRILFPIVEEFYQKYQKLISDSRISDNDNLIYSRIKKDVLDELKKLILVLWYQIREQILKNPYDKSVLYPEDLEKAKELIDKMEKNEESFNIEDLIKELESCGRKVTLLNQEESEVRGNKKIKRRENKRGIE